MYPKEYWKPIPLNKDREQEDIKYLIEQTDYIHKKLDRIEKLLEEMKE